MIKHCCLPPGRTKEMRTIPSTHSKRRQFVLWGQQGISQSFSSGIKGQTSIHNFASNPVTCIKLPQLSWLLVLHPKTEKEKSAPAFFNHSFPFKFIHNCRYRLNMHYIYRCIQFHRYISGQVLPQDFRFNWMPVRPWHERNQYLLKAIQVH